MPRVLFTLLLLLISPSPAARAERPSQPGCDAPPALSKTIKDQLSRRNASDSIDVSRATRPQTQSSPNLWGGIHAKWNTYQIWIPRPATDHMVHPELLAVIQKELRDRAAAHPGRPLGPLTSRPARCAHRYPGKHPHARDGTNPRAGIRMALLDLAQIYSSGKFADKAKFGEQLTKFWTACPTSQKQKRAGCW